MPGNKYIPVKPLSSFTKGGIREHMFDLAYDVLDSLESRIIRLRDMEAFAIDIQADPNSKCCYLADDYSRASINMEKLQNARRLVDEPLFTGEVVWDVEALVDVCKFDELVREIGPDVEETIARLERYFALALGKLPDEIPSGKLPDKTRLNLYWLKYDLDRELANLYGSSELPSLVASFESKSKDEVFKQAKGILDTLQPLLDEVTSLALECIYRGEGSFYYQAHCRIPQVYDLAEHMFNLRRYFKPSRHNGQAITKFMADKFDRSAARLDCYLRAYILCYKDFPRERPPAKLHIPSLQAEFKHNSQEQFYIRSKSDNRALKSLFHQFQEVWDNACRQGTIDKAELEAFRRDRLNFEDIRNRQSMTRSLRKRFRNNYFSGLSHHFLLNAFMILHGLARVDIKTLEKLISDAKMLKHR
ncbi:hypothetical protein CDV36_000729 [Fusarium kuroshium]|uniref:Uncharacterized protein n=1 Tax=Fusarium kuroshium TaxID=2010991 RepID=A0A3M2SQ15_9HYPO|nr:hypothetical protein CDV36_000729 [Fusarium kuroshium]